MSGYNRVPRYVSGQVAARQAFGMLGYASTYGAMKPDLDAWIADAQDLISPLKTYTEIPCLDFETCDNRIELPSDVAIITCAAANGSPMTYLPTKGCTRVIENHNQINRCNNSAQGFYIDGCYMKFKPAIPDGVTICIDGLGRPLDSEGCPMVAECCILAVSEYICKLLCRRYRDNRFSAFELDWLKHCKRARAELNQFANQDVRNLGYFWYKPVVFATFAPGWLGAGYSGDALRG